MPKTTWVSSPTNIALSDRSHWRKLPRKRYLATRAFIAILEYRHQSPKTGPPVLTLPLVDGVKPVFGNKEIIVVSNTTTITESIQQTFTNKVSSELSSTLGASLKDGFQVQLQSKISSEFTEQLSSQLSNVRTYQVQSTHEFMTSMSLEFPKLGYSKDKIVYNFYLPLWPVRWDIYLYRVETIELSYHWNWKIRKVRDVSPLSIIDHRMPLARISFYEPQRIPVASLGDYVPDVADAEEVLVESFDTQCPKLTVPLQSMSLHDCASLAFPMTDEEKELGKKAAKALNDAAKSRRFKLLEGTGIIGQLGSKPLKPSKGKVHQQSRRRKAKDRPEGSSPRSKAKQSASVKKRSNRGRVINRVKPTHASSKKDKNISNKSG